MTAPALLLRRMDAGARLHVRPLPGGLADACVVDADGYHYPGVPLTHAVAALGAERVWLERRLPCGTAVYARLAPPRIVPTLQPPAPPTPEPGLPLRRPRRPAVPPSETLLSQQQLCARTGVRPQQGQRLRRHLARHGYIAPWGRIPGSRRSGYLYDTAEPAFRYALHALGLTLAS